ncbi:hypothetical protein GIB67_010341 [Kingdonia uniflora]|uniref:Enhancer of polycomb-like protein n=1 Tax=Kingdonia uniflora TaxID=39325 RepID=A0A7J7MA68_9MAGN|nr:hypothetical protein GIB67_010341 [Kingdonia uniflora]
MPSVGMRRSTRVFVPKLVAKDSDEVRNLRSTKQFSLHSVGDRILVMANTLDNTFGREVLLEMGNAALENNGGEDKRVDIVYTRKRRKLSSGNMFVSLAQSQFVNKKRMFGKKYFRKRWRNVAVSLVGKLVWEEKGYLDIVREISWGTTSILHVVVDSGCRSNGFRFTDFLVLVLSYMRKSRLRLSQLVAFMCSEPICQVFSQHGLHFFPPKGSFSRISSKRDVVSPGVCQIFAAKKFMPLFSVNFSAMPSWFMGVHVGILLRCLFPLNGPMMHLMGLAKTCHGVTDDEISLSCVSTEIVSCGGDVIGSEGLSVKKRKVEFVVRGSDSPGRGSFSRPNVNFRNIPKRRSSTRSRKARIPTSMRWHCDTLQDNLGKIIRSNNKRSGAVGSDSFEIENRLTSTSPLIPNHNQTIPVQSNPCSNLRDLRFTLDELSQNIDSASCSANVLVFESDKCYREEGVSVTLELSSSNEWCIMVYRQGSTRYTLKAEEMRPSIINRFTHAIIWTGANGWKLEFPDRRDWMVFKEIFNECRNRNYEVPSPRAIPVPGVYEVPSYDDIEFGHFVRPNDYIKSFNDELSRTLEKMTPIYDMDSDDVELLQNLSNGLCDGEHRAPEYQLSVRNFEFMIDVFEKGCYYSPSGTYEESTAVDVCQNLGSRDLVVAVHQHWLSKRKQKPLLRVFQLYPPPKRAQSMQEPTTRRKRSSIKQAHQYGKGK